MCSTGNFFTAVLIVRSYGNCDQIRHTYMCLVLSFNCCYVCTLVKHSGNLTFDAVLDIARTMRPRSMARTMAGTVKEILGELYNIG